MAYTYLQLRQRINDIPGLPKNEVAADLDALINDSYFYVVAALGCLIKSVVKPLTAADGDYNFITDFALPDFAGVRALYYRAANGLSTFGPLVPVSVAELLSMRTSNPTLTSPAVAYSIPGWGNLSLQPLPATGDTLTIIYAAFPVTLAAPGDTPVALPPHLHHLIVGHCAAVAMERKDVGASQRMMEQFEEREMKRARRWMNNAQSSLPFAPGAYRRGVNFPSDYWSHY